MNQNKKGKNSEKRGDDKTSKSISQISSKSKTYMVSRHIVNSTPIEPVEINQEDFPQHEDPYSDQENYDTINKDIKVLPTDINQIDTQEHAQDTQNDKNVFESLHQDINKNDSTPDVPQNEYINQSNQIEQQDKDKIIIINPADNRQYFNEANQDVKDNGRNKKGFNYRAQNKFKQEQKQEQNLIQEMQNIKQKIQMKDSEIEKINSQILQSNTEIRGNQGDLTKVIERLKRENDQLKKERDRSKIKVNRNIQIIDRKNQNLKYLKKENNLLKRRLDGDYNSFRYTYGEKNEEDQDQDLDKIYNRIYDRLEPYSGKQIKRVYESSRHGTNQSNTFYGTYGQNKLSPTLQQDSPYSFTNNKFNNMLQNKKLQELNNMDLSEPLRTIKFSNEAKTDNRIQNPNYRIVEKESYQIVRDAPRERSHSRRRTSVLRYKNTNSVNERNFFSPLDSQDRTHYVTQQVYNN